MLARTGTWHGQLERDIPIRIVNRWFTHLTDRGAASNAIQAPRYYRFSRRGRVFEESSPKIAARSCVSAMLIPVYAPGRLADHWFAPRFQQKTLLSMMGNLRMRMRKEGCLGEGK